MLTRPDGLSDELLTRALVGGWDITPAAISYLAVGYGSHHWQTTAIEGARWFVTVDDLAERLRSPADTTDAAYGRLRSALLTARALHESGASFAVTPVATVDGDVLHRIGEAYALAVYPFVDGQAREYGDALAPADLAAILPLITAVHGAPASVRGHARTDDFLLAGAGVLRRALDDLAGRWDGGPYGEPARRLLTRHASSLDRQLRHRDQLAGQASSWPDRMVLTHGEPHPGNFIQVGRQPMLVDWDTALMAPPERDLWLLDPGDGSFTEAYAGATGRDILPLMLDLYRLTWELSDIVGCLTKFTGEHGDTVTDRAEWEILNRSLSLGRMVVIGPESPRSKKHIGPPGPPAWPRSRRRARLLGIIVIYGHQRLADEAADQAPRAWGPPRHRAPRRAFVSLRHGTPDHRHHHGSRHVGGQGRT
jgi:aminoglycoside phosphotransferase (APT) family kinase protein